MSTTLPALNPSQTVEKIREIIVGRHLEKLELRVVQLEASGPKATAIIPSATHLEDRLIAQEARIEAIQHNVSRLTESTPAHDLRLNEYREETQRLANQIQQIAAIRSAEAAAPPGHQLERKIGNWLTDWQASFHNQLRDRDQRFTQQLRSEVASLMEKTESKLTRLENRIMDRELIEERFCKIATAARALAECGPAPAPASLSSLPSR